MADAGVVARLKVWYDGYTSKEQDIFRWSFGRIASLLTVRLVPQLEPLPIWRM